jgi:hypothetical protein
MTTAKLGLEIDGALKTVNGEIFFKCPKLLNLIQNKHSNLLNLKKFSLLAVPINL